MQRDFRPEAVSLTFRRQRGFTLIESLVAFAVVSLGTVSVIRLQRDLRFNADLAGQRADATQLGQASIEYRRTTAGMDATAAPDDTSTVPSSTTKSRNTTYTVGMSLGAPIADAPATFSGTGTGTGTGTGGAGGAAGGGAGGTGSTGATFWAGGSTRAEAASVTVGWPDITGTPRSILLETIVGQANPALSAALSIRPIDSGVISISGRAAFIPSLATNLGNGQSAWKPSAANSLVWLFDNASGRIVGRCTGRSSVATTPDLTLDDLSQCVASKAVVLSGFVRTSLALPPDAARANEPPEALAVVLTLTAPAQAGQPSCISESQRSVEAVFGTGATATLRREAVPSTATPAAIGADHWFDLGDRFVAYRCVVVDAPGGWTGRTTVVPVAPLDGVDVPATWKIGTSSTTRKVCRYVSPDEHDGTFDPNAAHPAEYSAVTASLAMQNFLIVRGDQACPDATVGSLVTTRQQQP